jgi:hypothetical protein
VTPDLWRSPLTPKPCGHLLQPTALLLLDRLQDLEPVEVDVAQNGLLGQASELVGRDGVQLDGLALEVLGAGVGVGG